MNKIKVAHYRKFEKPSIRSSPSESFQPCDMNDPTVKFTLDVTAQSETQLEGYCARFLKERGFNVTAPHAKWETVGDFKNRLGISYMTVSRKTKDTPNRPNVAIQRGSQKRIVAILSNPDFDAYCVANK